MKAIIKKIKNTDNGFVVFFTVLIATIILAITIGITNISLKELNFTATGKESHFALFSADSASECALYNDRNVDFLSTLPATAAMTCGGQNITAKRVDLMTGGSSYTFDNLSLDKGCAIITISKNIQVGATATDLGTKIEAKGYNVACTDLTTSNPHRVERILDYIYLNDAAGTTTGVGGGTILGSGSGTTADFNKTSTTGGTLDMGKTGGTTGGTVMDKTSSTSTSDDSLQQDQGL